MGKANIALHVFLFFGSTLEGWNFQTLQLGMFFSKELLEVSWERYFQRVFVNLFPLLQEKETKNTLGGFFCWMPGT